MARRQHIRRRVVVRRQMARRRAFAEVFDRRVAAVVGFRLELKAGGIALVGGCLARSLGACDLLLERLQIPAVRLSNVNEEVAALSAALDMVKSQSEGCLAAHKHAMHKKEQKDPKQDSYDAGVRPLIKS